MASAHSRTALRFISLFSVAGSLLFLLLLVNTFLVTPIRVDGASMEPTLDRGALVLVGRRDRVTRGSIVGIKISQGQRLIKRIIGLPSERVTIKDGELLISGLGVSEPYLTTPETSGNTELQLAADEYFLLGDNRIDSLDSRQFGPVKRSELIGPAIFELWPRFRYLN